MTLTEADVRAAMEAVPAYIDITAADFREIYHLAFEHALKRLGEAIRVRNLLKPEVVTVHPDTPLPEVTALMIRHRISGLPVVDDAGRVVGVVSEHDFVTHARAEDGRTVIEILPAEAGAAGQAGAGAYAHVAADIMTRDVATLDEDAPLPEIAASFGKWQVNRLPVTDDAGRLKGLVCRWDLVQSVLAAFADPAPS
jgi:CBS domain-containing protein